MLFISLSEIVIETLAIIGSPSNFKTRVLQSNFRAMLIFSTLSRMAY